MAKSKTSNISLVREIVKDFKNKTPKNIYCFDGEEEYYINKLETSFENDILSASEKDFNLNIFYGRDADWKQILNAAQQSAMFGGKQLVMIKEAASFKDFKELEPYLSQLPSHTHLFISHKHKKIDGRSSFLKTISSLGVYARFEKLNEDAIPAWIINYCKEHKIVISEQNASLLALNLGSDLQKIANELEKVQLNIKEGEEISAELIEKYIGISKDYNLYEYTDAILAKNKTKAFKILNYVIANPKAMNTTPVIATLFGSYSALYVFFKLGKPAINVLQESLGLNYYVAKKCSELSRLYNEQSTKKALYILEEMALLERGFMGTTKETSVHKELVGKLLSL
jgi:DNA polymerase III subunit delta